MRVPFVRRHQCGPLQPLHAALDHDYAESHARTHSTHVLSQSMYSDHEDAVLLVVGVLVRNVGLRRVARW